MRLSQSASVSSSKRGDGNRLGTRTRKKHKRLDAISEDVFNRNRRVKNESNEGSSRRESITIDSEVRRSSRVRKVPVVLDSSPPPAKKRRKVDKLGKKKKISGGSVEKSRGKGKIKREATPSSSGNSSDEELGVWRARLRSREVKSVKINLKGIGNKSHRKRKLFKDLEDGEEMKSVKDDLEDNMLCLDDENSRTPSRVRGLIDGKDDLCDDHPVNDNLENGVDAVGDEDEEDDHTLSTSGRMGRNEEIMDDSLVHVVEKESEVPTDVPVKENQNGSMENCEQNDEPLISSRPVEDAENQSNAVEVSTLPTDLAEDEGCNVHKPAVAESEVKLIELENDAKVGNCNVTTGGIRKPRIKEGRRCGLCGGGTNGKPPKRLANDSVGSDHEAYSGSSASEECNYDAWDGFGDEPCWLGKLLGPVNDRYGIAGIWVHQQCAVWSPEVYFAGLGCLKNIRAALCRGRALKCTRCGRPGATLGCRVDRCPRTYHLPCARASGCIFDHRKFLIACADHRYLFEPHGHQYLQRIKKLKAKKMKLEMRKLSNDASRKDLEAEEKWLERCGEDEEFLRRETKRLQRDLLRTAPIYIGGSHSEGENLIEGWESVAGLQDVIQCMKEVVIMPLLYPEFFENMGITPPRGVLLHGYPGTGKTLVVRSLIGSCARGDKRIAYFARKGADCLGKYVGDAERQLRLLFQVAERSQPSIIFFDEIDGLAPVRTRQQDQTHSSVVSTLLALMDGLKSRGSVIVIGATNRPDAIDPALRRPGRFDREVYFPLPSVKDRAAILALHTRKWPKPVSGPLLNWVATKTVGFAGADLQALCAQAALIALKRNCPWQEILSSAGNDSTEGKRPQLPAFTVEERDWLEALTLCPPPCSRREAGMAANEVMGSPLHIYLAPCLLQPLVKLIISLYLDDRLWLPHRLVSAGEAIKSAVISLMEKKSLGSDRWWCHTLSMVQDSDTATEMVKILLAAGILDGHTSFTRYNLLHDISLDDSRFHPCSLDVNRSGLPGNLFYTQSKKAGYRILIAGEPRCGQKHLASCLLHCFVDSIEIQKIDLATISQEGHGDMEQGISRILMKCASVKLCAIFMPRIDLWALESCSLSVQEDSEASPDYQFSKESFSKSSEIVGEECNSLPCKSELVEVTAPKDELWVASATWKSFIGQATSELPCAALPHEVRQFFGSEPLTLEDSAISKRTTPRFIVEIDREFDRDLLIHSSAWNLSMDLLQQFVQLVHHGNHAHSDSNIASEALEDKKDPLNHKTDLKSVEEPGFARKLSEGSVTNIPIQPVSRNAKGKSSLLLAISTFGYQILRYPHFAELCWVTSKLNEGPSADIRGPWKGWPFNSCIIRPCKLIQKETVVCNSNNNKAKDKFTLVRGLVAVALMAYRGEYTTSVEVSLEVRKVLELLVGQISARIQAGKDRYQFIRLLSQVAYLEDMVNNWSHSLRSLEPEAQTTMMNPKHAGVQSPSDNQMQVVEKPDIQDSRSVEPEFVEAGVQGYIPASSQPAFVNGDNLTELATPSKMSPEKVVPSNHVLPDICLAGEDANQENGSLKEILLTNNPVYHGDFEGSPVIDQPCTMIVTEKNSTKCEALSSKHLETFDQPMDGTCNSGNLGSIELCGSSDLCNQSNTEVHISDGRLPDSNLSSERGSHLSSHSEVVCSYSCCVGCIYTLHQLAKKIVTREWNLSVSCSTVDDFHDLVSSLSTSLFSAIRNPSLTGGCNSVFNGEPSSEASRELFESWEMNTCQCETSENKFTMLTECVCHSGKDVCKEVSSSYTQPQPDCRYIFRDGVFVSEDFDKEVSFHCKYENLCLCSLIKLILCTKQPLD